MRDSWTTWCPGAMTRGSGHRWCPKPTGGLANAPIQRLSNQLRRPAQVTCRIYHQVSWRLPGGIVAGCAELRPVAACHLREERDLAELSSHEVPVDDLTVTRHDLAVAGSVEQVTQRGGPVERERVAERGRCALLHEVAGEGDPGVRHQRDHVVIRVAATEELEVHPAVAEVEGGAAGERPIGRVDRRGQKVIGDLGHLRGAACPAGEPKVTHEARAPILAPDLAWAERGVPKDVVEMGVGVEHDVWQPAHVPQVLEQFPSLDQRGSRVDDEDAIAANHRADRLVEEREAPDEDKVSDLAPRFHLAAPARAGAAVGWATDAGRATGPVSRSGRR